MYLQCTSYIYIIHALLLIAGDGASLYSDDPNPFLACKDGSGRGGRGEEANAVGENSIATQGDP